MKMLKYLVAIGCMAAIFGRVQGQAPQQKDSMLKPILVPINQFDTSIHLDIRYATENNFSKKAVYQEAKAFLHKPAAEALAEVSKLLRNQGYGLLIFDGYRPWSITKLFWDITPEDKRIYVADPAQGSRHNKGCAVDLTLYDLKTGMEVPMPSEYDDMSEHSHPDYSGGELEKRNNRDLLRKTMEANGFTVLPFEWWHFDFRGWERYQNMNVQFSEIK